MPTSNTFSEFALYDAREVRRSRERFRRDLVPELQYANSLYVNAGRWPARGWLLMRRDDYDQLDKYALHTLTIQDFGHRDGRDDNAAVTFNDLAIVQARCVTTGVADSPDAIYLVEVTDQRGVVWNKWFEQPTTSQYNIRAPAYPGEFYSASTNGGTAWTFNGMVGDLWSQMVTFLGTYGSLPVTPSWTPEGWAFPGTSCWLALNSILDYLGLNLVADLTAASGAQYSIVEPNSTDPDNDDVFAAFAEEAEDDWEYIDVGQGRVPGAVQVMFHRRNEYYGTEETVRRDSLQWQSTPLYQKTITSATYPDANGTAILWADFTVRYDTDNNPVAADVTTAASIAQTLADLYYGRITRGAQGFMRQVYVGAVPFSVGSSIDGVCWRQDQHRRKGWVTEVMRGAHFPQVMYGCP